jgi:two-component system chemotaxis sensor kinase CheA
MAETLMGQLRDLSQLETQLLGNLAELQQSTAALRARPVATILRPLAAMAATESRRNRREARMTTAGGELALDVALLESLKHILRPLVMARLGQGLEAPQQMHLAVNRSDDQLSVMLEDDGGAAPPDAALTPVRDEIARAGGNLRLVRLPTGGLRVHIVVPMNLVVMEGMVVGVGGTRYVLPVEAIRSILQPDPAAVISVSVQGGQRWLRLGKEEIVMIQPLPTATGQGPGAARRAPAMPGDTAPEAPRHGGIHVVVGRGGRSIAIPVDDLVGQQLVLLRPLRGVMSRLRNVSGVALLSGGEIGMVLSPSTLCGRPELDDRPAEALSA